MSPAKVDDLQTREPVWQALSDMFLDTDTSLSRPWRAEQLARSPYAIEELERILVNEVYPVCRYNLLSVAGEWAGFDAAWLRTRILRRLGSPFRCLHVLDPGGFLARRHGEWRATREAVVARRAAPQHPF